MVEVSKRIPLASTCTFVCVFVYVHSHTLHTYKHLQILKGRYMIHYSMKCSFIYIHSQTDFQIHGTEPALVLNYRITDLVKGIHSVPRAAVFTFTFEHQNLL